ncbi:MAG: methyl-accepting chemotaxis protein [Aliivibrio sp.]|uniref:methyl-accepting chemotaxis protein n=1 Tax=Aliivibrio sp. TaxID=1872443 RepID=UPI001A3D1F48|nr:methyl-accepting chemotaxis protein [Aliivibrio sp.]
MIMTIKQKLILLTLLSITALLGVAFSGWYSQQKVMTLNDEAIIVSEMEVTLLTLRRNEKDFLSRENLKYIDTFKKNYEHLKELNIGLQKRLTSNGFDIDFSNINSSLEKYAQGFYNVGDAYKVLGVKGNEGVIDSFKSESEQFLLSIQPSMRYEYQSLVDDVMLFYYSDNIKYIDDYGKHKDNLSSDLLYQNQKEISDIDAIVTELVKVKTELGLSYSKGLKGDIRETSRTAEGYFKELSKSVSERLDSEKSLTLKYSIMFVIFLIIVSTVVTTIISRDIRKRISGLLITMTTISENQDLTLQADDSGKDELAEVALSFNQFLTNLRNLIEESKQVSMAVGSASEQLLQSSRSTSDSLSKQEDETRLVATSIVEMAGTISDISENTEQAAENARQSHTKANEGSKQVEKTCNTISNLSTQLSEASNEVTNLSELSHSIGSVLDVIRDIAEQTNLLALNAAIEAARAGDQGRGFAVVADEVRALAQRTSKSTEEISTIINSLQKQTHEVVGKISVCRDLGEESVTEASSAQLKLNEIIVEMQSIMDNSSQIAEALDQQKIVSEEVNQNVTAIQEITGGNNRAVSENSTAVQSIVEQVSGLSDSISKFKS